MNSDLLTVCGNVRSFREFGILCYFGGSMTVNLFLLIHEVYSLVYMFIWIFGNKIHEVEHVGNRIK